MRDNLSIATLVISAVAFIVVLFSPAPEAPSESAGTRPEGIVNRGQGEVNALDEDSAELEQLRSRSAALDALGVKARPDDDGTDKLVAMMIEREVARRLPAFQNQLKIIRLYEKKAGAKTAAEKTAAAKAAAKERAAARAVAVAKKRAALKKAKKAAETKAEQEKVEGAEK